MNYHNRVLGAAALCVAAIAVPTEAAPVASESAALVSANTAGLEFTLKLPAGKTSFMQGETIPLSLSFVNNGPQKLYLREFYQPPPSFLPFASFVVEPKEGTSNPLGDLPVPTFISIAGAIPLPVRLAAIPTQEPFLLNEYVRFDLPGTYTIRAVTSRVFARPEGTAPPLSSIFPAGKAIISTSEPISLRIVPADPKWQAEQVQAWRAFWAKQKADFVRLGGRTALDTVRPANDLRFLNTRAAAQAIIDRLGQDEFPRSSNSEAYFWQAGLVGFSDRPWLIEAMKSAMKRPDYPVTQGFLDNLATLKTLQAAAMGIKQQPANFFAQSSLAADEEGWNLALASLDPKKGRARAMTVHSLLESAWYSPLQKVPEVQKRLPLLVAQVPDIFDDLPPTAQQNLLDIYGHPGAWPRIKSPRMAAPLRQLWNAMPITRNDSYHYFPNAILSHLYEVDPAAGRALILKEMAAPTPRVSFEVLSLLPDKRLPQLQKLWLAHLSENGADQDTAAMLIDRYANDDIKPQVQKEFADRQRNHMFSVSTQQGLERYLSRVK